MLRLKMQLSAVAFGLIVFLGPYLLACAPDPVSFAIKHLRDTTGEQQTEVVSYLQETGLDNSAGSAPLQVQIEFSRTYRYQILDNITDNRISSDSVRDKIVETYKLPPNDPEGTVETALCPVSVVIPPGQNATVTVEWTERWAEGVINEGQTGEGDRLGTYRVFLGYIEPCSLINQENTAP